MSGGFFRGTSADQDTRFSNKQAKLLKTQKFASELDHLVDMTKVKMDVMKPWIARRVTELLGFEDEVLINFVYGLLDGKVVDGKQIQIQLTGFMEKNTGKFMRELWGLLLSAQNNASGVPQQFLDEKEEEMRKKKMESDRITQEIQKKKEGEGPEATEQKRLDGEADDFRQLDTTTDNDLKHHVKKDSSGNPELDWKHGSRRVKRQQSTSPPLNDHSPSVQRSPHAKSSSGTFSNSRSYSEGNHKSRSVSISASPPSPPASHDRRRQSVQRYSTSPHHRSPRILHSSRHLSPNLKHRSSSRTRHRSPSPLHRRSPVRVRRRSPPSPSHRSLYLRRRSRTPLRHRSPSPLHHRTAARSRYQSPLHWHRRSPSPSWRRSPLHHRSPIRSRRRSPSPLRQRSPSPQRKSQSPARRMSPSLFRRSPRHRSPTHKRRSPLRSSRYHAVDSQSLPRQRNRILDSEQTLSPERQRSSSRAYNNLGDGVDSGRHQERSHARSFRKDENEKSDLVHNKVESSSAKPLKARPETPAKPSHSISYAGGPREHENRIHSQSLSPINQKRGSKACYDNLEARRSENPGSREGLQQKISSSIRKSGGRLSETSDSEDFSFKKSAGKESFYMDIQVEMKLEDTHEERNVKRLESHSRQVSHLLSEDVEYGPGKGDEHCSPHVNDTERSNKQHPDSFFSLNEKPRKEKIRLGADEGKKSRSENDSSNVEKSETDSGNGEYKYHKAGKRSKRSEHNGTTPEDEVDCDSSIERRKETRRRRKEEKKIRREEKRRRREERHRKREERRALKKAKYMDTVTPPPESEQNNDMTGDSDGDPKLKVLRKSNVEEADFEQKKLEIELRNKALESLRAKKAISH